MNKRTDGIHSQTNLVDIIYPGFSCIVKGLRIVLLMECASLELRIVILQC